MSEATPTDALLGSQSHAADASRRPVASPLATEWVRQHPLDAGAVSFGEGFWAARLQVNTDASLAACLRKLDEAGNLGNLRAAAGLMDGAFRGRVFADTDVYKWLEAVSWTLQREWSAQWDEAADEVIALIVHAQAPDGYLDSYVQLSGGDRWGDLANDHEMYCAGHLMQAAVAHHRATGKTTLLTVAERFGDLLVNDFGAASGRPGYCGHPEIETALVELYRETGRRDFLDLAATMIGRRGSGGLGEGFFGPAYFQDERTVRESSEIRGHAVRALYLAAGVADLYLETGEAVLLQRMSEQWSDMINGKTYITGGVGSRHRDEAFGDRFELPSGRAYTETCAAIASMQWAWRMLLATGQADYADMFERTLFNGFLSGVSLDGERFFYVNPLQSRPEGTSTPSTRQTWYDCACCPPNVVRMFASLPHYFATRDETGLQLQQYADCTVRGLLADGTAIGCDITTRYPFDGRVQIVIPPECAGLWTLALRIPSWASGAYVQVGAEILPAPAGEYLRVRRQWQAADTLVLDLPMGPRLVAADSRIDALRGCLAVEQGPFVYCIEGLDQDGDVDDMTIVGVPELGPPHRGLSGLPTVRLAGTVGPPAPAGWPYPSIPDHDPSGLDGSDRGGRQVLLTAIPYFAWANRDPTPMRVWLPASKFGTRDKAPAERQLTTDRASINRIIEED